MPLLFPRAELRDLVAELLDLPVGAVVWDTEPLPVLNGARNGKPSFWVELQIHNTKTVGVDEQVYTFDAAKNINSIEQHGNRSYVISMKVRSYDPLVPSTDVVEQIRFGMRSRTAKEELTAVNLSLAEFLASVDLPKDADNREITTSVLDVKFNWGVSEAAQDENGNWIQSAPVTGTLTP